jgi:hypothetical protein
MKRTFSLFLVCIIILVGSCKKEDGGQEYLTLYNGESAYEAYESLQALYEEGTINKLVALDTLSDITSTKQIIPYYLDLIVLDSVHPDTMESFLFEFMEDTLHSISLFPSMTNIDTYPAYQVSRTIIELGISRDSIYSSLYEIHTQDTFYRLKHFTLEHKDLDTRFSNNMYNVETWYATEIDKNNNNYIIELFFDDGVLIEIDRYRE